MVDDFDLFKQEVAGVTPLQNDTVSTSAKKLSQEALDARRSAAEQQAEIDQQYLSMDYVELIHPEDIVGYKQDGIQDGVYKKLRLGKYPIQARLDLHQHRLEQARSELIRFIDESQKLQLRNLLVVHGKGKNQQPPAMLKSYVSQWLPQMSAVLAIHSALACHGGSGAVYVMLKKSEGEKLDNRERHARRLA